MRFKEFIDNWRKSNISNEFIFLTNNSLSRDDLNYNSGYRKNIHYGDILTKFATVKNINDTDVPYINSNIKLSNGFVKLISGDIIVADTAEDYTVGKAIEIYNPNSLEIYSGLHTIPLRPKNKFSIGYLAYYFNSYIHKKRIYPLIQGIKVYSISKSALSNSIIKFPSLEEQEKIAQILTKIDDRISTQKKIISKIESQIKTIKSQIFSHNIGAKKSMEDILDEVSIKSSVNNQYPVISSTVKGLVLQSEYFDKEIASPNNKGYKIITKNNIIISPQNLWMGNITFNDKFENGIVSPSYKIFNVKEGYNKLYIFELMTTKKSFYLYKTVSEQGASVVRRNLNFEAFMQLTYNIPSIEEQNKIIENLYLLKNKYENEKKILSLYEKQKQYLLNKMFI